MEMDIIWEHECVDCKYYESYHKYPNSNVVARHYCKRWHEEIIYKVDYDYNEPLEKMNMAIEILKSEGI